MYLNLYYFFQFFVYYLFILFSENWWSEAEAVINNQSQRLFSVVAIGWFSPCFSDDRKLKQWQPWRHWKRGKKNEFASIQTYLVYLYPPILSNVGLRFLLELNS